jgi:hypothetical protein
MSTRLLTDNGVLIVGESPDDVYERIRGTSDGFIELTGIGGSADSELKEAGASGLRVRVNITEITVFREAIEHSSSNKSLNPPEFENRANNN